MLRRQLSYANVVATIALFVTLGGSAVAAGALTRDSVGARELRTDAVRSPEIKGDAVRSPEIRADAVRASELAPGAVGGAALTDAAKRDLRPELIQAELDFADVAICDTTDVRNCPDIQTIDPGASGSDEPTSSWLVQAKVTLDTVERTPGAGLFETCGLVNTERAGPAAVIDAIDVRDGDDHASLVAVVKQGAGDPAIALRCTNNPNGQEFRVRNLRVTALELGAVSGP